MVDLHLQGQGHVHTSFCIFWNSQGMTVNWLLTYTLRGHTQEVHTLLKNVLKWEFLRGPGSMQGAQRVF